MIVRKLSELNINLGGKPVSRPAPTADVIAAFEKHFGVKLPADLLKLLHYSNGGHPQRDTIEPVSRPRAARWAVNGFYHLDSDKTSVSSLWRAVETWRPILGNEALPFAATAGGDQFFLDLKAQPPPVKGCVHDENFAIVELAPSLEAFIDALAIDPDMI